MGTVKKFIPKAERIAKEKADQARQGVLNLDLPASVTDDMLVSIQRHENGGIAKWTFNMISPAQCLAVWSAIKKGDKPIETRDVFDLVLTHIETNTGIVTLTREEIAERVGIAPKHVSSAMGRLEQIGAVMRERVKVPGMKGPGKARYRLNPHVAWNGELNQREKQTARDRPPLPFDLIDGGKDDGPESA